MHCFAHLFCPVRKNDSSRLGAAAGWLECTSPSDGPLSSVALLSQEWACAQRGSSGGWPQRRPALLHAVQWGETRVHLVAAGTAGGKRNGGPASAVPRCVSPAATAQMMKGAGRGVDGLLAEQNMLCMESSRVINRTTAIVLPLPVSFAVITLLRWNLYLLVLVYTKSRIIRPIFMFL